MIPLETVQQFKTEISNELLERILPFWMDQTVDVEKGGFYGQISNDLTVNKEAEKSCILNSRILWTFASAYRIFQNEHYRIMAGKAFDYLVKCFWDSHDSGLYFMVDAEGRVTNPRKQVYNMAFGIYGLAEYYRATGCVESLSLAIQLYQLIEENSHDNIHRGYFEACSRDWKLIDDMRLSDKDLNEKKSMNTHLHLLEAYTNLLRVWDDDQLRRNLQELMNVMIEYIIDPDTHHFKLFFDEYWNSKLSIVSFGHDIEGSWLLYEAAEVLGDKSLLKKVKDIAVNMAQIALEEGLDAEYGGLFNECDNGVIEHTEKVWWPQCEAMVGFVNAYELTGKDLFFEAAFGVWRFSDKYLIDKKKGEWFWEVSREGKPQENHYKVGPWKCPYHNGRACMEIMMRLNHMVV